MEKQNKKSVFDYISGFLENFWFIPKGFAQLIFLFILIVGIITTILKII